jgi:hypothetical protein
MYVHMMGNKTPETYRVRRPLHQAHAKLGVIIIVCGHLLLASFEGTKIFLFITKKYFGEKKWISVINER